jgi:hypothetical protein
MGAACSVGSGQSMDLFAVALFRAPSLAFACNLLTIAVDAHNFFPFPPSLTSPGSCQH